MKKSLLSIFLVSIFFVAYSIPDRPKPARLVNDFAGVFSADEIRLLEAKLVDFDNSTTTQITVVTVNSLDGMDPDMYAFEILDKWQVGQEKSDNGIVVLFKPKTADAKGEVAISVGYGLEPVIPDAIAKRIIENEMIPEFRNGQTYLGIDKAVNTIMKLSLGEFSAAEYEQNTKKQEKGGSVIGLIIFIVIFLVFISIGRSGGSSIGRRSNLPLWLLLSLLSSGGSRSGGFGNFSSGGGSFGGFGGGGGGGGGASGSW